MTKKENIILFYDTETSGFRSNAKAFDDPSQAWTVQLGWILSTEKRIISEHNFILKPFGQGLINPFAQKTHGISPDDAKTFGHIESYALSAFMHDSHLADLTVCHNRKFDIDFLHDCISRVHGIELASGFGDLPYYCTMLESTELCQLPKKRGQGFKWPKLDELHHFLFEEGFEGAHDALADVRATRRCYYELKKRGL